jgi:hydroxypyruvate isomerase
MGSRPGDFGLAALPGREAEARTAIDEAIAYAAAIGAGAVHVMAGKPESGGKARRTYLDALAYAAGRAEAAGQIVLIEPLNPRDAPGYFLKTSAQAAEIIAEVGRENIKLLFDCYHLQIVEGDLTRRLERLLPIIGHVQIAAVPSRAEPDEGEINYPGVFQALDTLGWSGWTACEYKPRGRTEDGLSWGKRFGLRPKAK